MRTHFGDGLGKVVQALLDNTEWEKVLKFLEYSNQELKPQINGGANSLLSPNFHKNNIKREL